MKVMQLFSLLFDVEIIPKETAIYDIEVIDLNKQLRALAYYRNKALLIVNIASHCGFNKQLGELEHIYKKYHAAGLEILGVPSHDFFQEPYDNRQILEFCVKNYGVSFPILSKAHVRGQHKHALYAYLTSRKTNPQFSGSIKWNFSKFLIDQEGHIRARFAPFTSPQALKVREAIESLL